MFPGGAAADELVCACCEHVDLYEIGGGFGCRRSGNGAEDGRRPPGGNLGDVDGRHCDSDSRIVVRAENDQGAVDCIADIRPAFIDSYGMPVLPPPLTKHQIQRTPYFVARVHASGLR